MNKKTMVVSSLLLMLLAFGIAAYFVRTIEVKKITQEVQENKDAFVRDYSMTLGNKNAKVTLVEFFDPACETCRDFYPFVKHMMKQYPDKIQLVMRYAPFHQGADYYVKILEAAREQNKYWETLELLYQSQNYWASHHQAKPDLAWEVLSHIELDLAKLKVDMESPKVAQILKQDWEDGISLKVNKTPSFFVNQKPLIQFGYEQLKSLIESEIQVQYPNELTK